MTEAGISNTIKHMLISALLPAKGMPIPNVIHGVNELGKLCSKLNLKNMLVVSDKILVELGSTKKCTDGLKKANVNFFLFDKVVPNCPEKLIIMGYNMYKRNKCDGIIAVGGGSSMDCAKVIGAKVANPDKSIESFVGSFNVSKRDEKRMAMFPPLIAVPTTAGTGSETTIVAVVHFEKSGLKEVITDSVLVPKYAVLDADLTISLPKHVTATTGMDALTHAIESYLSTWANERTKEYSLKAVKQIGQSLMTCYHYPKNTEARSMMLQASFDAGVAFTNTSVGYVHAIAHTLGAFFGVPHGAANAMILPLVLDFYLDTCMDKFCDLAVALGIATFVPEDIREKKILAQKFVRKIREMNVAMQIQTKVKDMKVEDVDRVVTRAMVEAHGKGSTFNPFDAGYPVPTYLTRAHLTQIVNNIVPKISKL